MGRINGINLYKHGITRTYLNLDDDGNCFRPTGGGCYQPADFHDEIHTIDEHLKLLGYSLDTSYDSSFIAAKEQTLRRQGMAVVVLQVTPEDIKIN